MCLFLNCTLVVNRKVMKKAIDEMIVPFIFNMTSFQAAPYLWWFYKGVEFARRTRGVIIAQEIYCTVSPCEFIKVGRAEAYHSGLYTYVVEKKSEEESFT